MSYQPQHPRLLGVERRAGNLIEHLADRPGPLTAYRLAKLRRVQDGLWELFGDDPIQPRLDKKKRNGGTVYQASFDAGNLVLSELAKSWELSYSDVALSADGEFIYTAGFGDTRISTPFDHQHPAHRRQLKVALKTADLLLP